MSGQNGGRRPGAGRPPGSRNKRTQALLEGAASAGLLPIDYMLGVMRDENQPVSTRLDAAKSAAPYLHTRLMSVEHSVNPEGRDERELTTDELRDEINRVNAAIAQAAGAAAGDAETPGSSGDAREFH